MTRFPAYGCSFELYPNDGEAFEHLSPLLGRLERIEFSFQVNDPSVNQGQMVSGFDNELENTLRTRGATPFKLRLPPEIPQELDFAFAYGGRSVAVEIEKANREKILRDILKCHMYLRAGADFALIGLPKNYPHKLGVWNLFEFGVQRFKECITYGFGTSAMFGRILLLGFEQCSALTGKPLCPKARQQMREEAGANSRRP